MYHRLSPRYRSWSKELTYLGGKDRLRLNLQTFFVKHEIKYLRNLTTYDTIEIIFKNRIFDQSLTVVELLTMSSHLYLHR